MNGVVWAAAAVAAVAELDVASVAQIGVSRPMVLGPAMGAGLGDVSIGVVLGVFAELFDLAETPVGGRLPLNATVAVAAALLLFLGPAAVPVEAAFPAGLLAGAIHAQLETVLRERRAAAAARVSARLAQDKPPRLARELSRELLLQAGATFALLAGVLACGGTLSTLWAAAPAAAREGLSVGLGLAPFLALASLAHSFRVVS